MTSSGTTAETLLTNSPKLIDYILGIPFNYYNYHIYTNIYNN